MIDLLTHLLPTLDCRLVDFRGLLALKSLSDRTAWNRWGKNNHVFFRLLKSQELLPTYIDVVKNNSLKLRVSNNKCNDEDNKWNHNVPWPRISKSFKPPQLPLKTHGIRHFAILRLTISSPWSNQFSSLPANPGVKFRNQKWYTLGINWTSTSGASPSGSSGTWWQRWVSTSPQKTFPPFFMGYFST